MTLDEVMAKHHGKWDNDNAVIMDRGGFFWIIAKRSGATVTITTDGKRYVTEAVAEKPKPKADPVKHTRAKSIQNVVEYNNE